MQLIATTVGNRAKGFRPAIKFIPGQFADEMKLMVLDWNHEKEMDAHARAKTLVDDLIAKAQEWLDRDGFVEQRR